MKKELNRDALKEVYDVNKEIHEHLSAERNYDGKLNRSTVRGSNVVGSRNEIGQEVYRSEYVPVSSQIYNPYQDRENVILSSFNLIQPTAPAQSIYNNYNNNIYQSQQGSEVNRVPSRQSVSEG